MFSKGFTVAILLTIGFVLIANVRCAPEQVRILWSLSSCLIVFSWKLISMNNYSIKIIIFSFKFQVDPENLPIRVSWPRKCWKLCAKQKKELFFWLWFLSIGSPAITINPINSRCSRCRLTTRRRCFQKCSKLFLLVNAPVNSVRLYFIQIITFLQIIQGSGLSKNIPGADSIPGLPRAQRSIPDTGVRSE